MKIKKSDRWSGIVSTTGKGCNSYRKEMLMETRVAIIAIIVENADAAESINTILHEYSDAVIGRMGIPYRQKGINIISVAVDTTQNDINTIAGRIGRLDGVTAKTVYSAT